MVMRGVAASGFAGLCASIAALELFSFLDAHAAGTGTTTSARDETPLLHRAAEVFPPLAALGVLFVAVAHIYHHLTGRRAAGNGRRSISRHLVFVLCVSAGTIEFVVFGRGAGAGHGAQARELGLAALRALPAAATATYFLGMMLIVVAHAAGGAVAAAGDGPIQGLLLRVLTKVAAGAAAALVGLMAMALILYGGSKF